MRFTDLFIRRPILAIVVSALILLVGGSAIFMLPLREYPNMESATIVVDTSYPGATQEVMQGFVTTPIAQAIATASGIEYRLTARHSPRDNFPNGASRMVVHTTDTDIEPVTLDGLVFSRTSRVGGGSTEVSYQLLDGPYNITLRVVSRGEASRGEPTDEFRALAAYAETIQRTP